MKKFNIILLVLWMIVIFMFSNQPSKESTKVTNKLTTTVIHLISDITGKEVGESRLEEILDSTFVFVRKSAHVIEYCILGILILNVLKDYFSFDKNLIILALFLSFFYASTDEFHQLFIDGRSAELKDVIIDSCGSLIGISIYYFSYHTFKVKKEIEKRT